MQVRLARQPALGLPQSVSQLLSLQAPGTSAQHLSGDLNARPQTCIISALSTEVILPSPVQIWIIFKFKISSLRKK